MRVLISIPIVIILIILQTVIVRQLPLLQGSADLVMLALVGWALQRRVQTAWHWAVIAGLLVSFVSTIPFYVNMAGYLLVVGMSLYIRQRIWQVSVVIMFITSFLATLITQLLVLTYLLVIDVPLPVIDAINLIILPSLLLNMLLAAPFYIWMSDLANWLFPEPLEA